ncbi:MAG: polysaccharide biosynthesis C-terminal domain-containing protein [Clostridia bacterium]|nr:polysaccharide biosynthesis C-terminal domain-containing protein [Clostridia bacterium]
MRSKNAIKNIIISLLLQIIKIVFGFIIPKLIIKTYGSSVNGLINSIVQFLGYIVLLEGGIAPVAKALLYKPIAEKNKQEIQIILKATEKCFKNIAKIFIIYIIILCCIYPTIVEQEFSSIFTISLIIIIAISVFAEYFLGITYKMYIQAEQRSYVISFIELGTIILNTILVVILIYCECNIQIIKLVSTLVFVLRPIIQNIYVKKIYNIDLKNVESNYKIKQKWDGIAQHIAYIIHVNTDLVVLTIFTNMKEVSVYSIYLLVVNGIKSIVQSFSNSIDSLWGDMIAKDEKENLNIKFKSYELFYYTLISIIYVCTIILIVPFIKVYTFGVNDANYVRPVFGVVFTTSEFIWAIMQPYNNLAKASGAFKETKKGAYIQAILNIIISIALVYKYGIIGVAIGTLVSIIVRTIELMYYISKYILKRNVNCIFNRLLIVLIEIILIICICKNVSVSNMTSYLEWIKYGLKIFIISIIIIVPVNLIIYRKDAKKFYIILNQALKNKE